MKKDYEINLILAEEGMMLGDSEALIPTEPI